MSRGSIKKNFEIFSCEKFIAAITQRISEKNSRWRDTWPVLSFSKELVFQQKQGREDQSRSPETRRSNGVFGGTAPRRLCCRCPTISHAGCHPKHRGELIKKI